MSEKQIDQTENAEAVESSVAKKAAAEAEAKALAEPGYVVTLTSCPSMKNTAHPLFGEFVVSKYHVGNDLKEAIKKFGEAEVFDGFKQSVKVEYQGVVRRLMNAGLTREGIEEKLTGWVPGTVITAEKDTTAAIVSKIANSSPEEGAKYMAQLEAALAAAKAAMGQNA